MNLKYSDAFEDSHCPLRIDTSPLSASSLAESRLSGSGSSPHLVQGTASDPSLNLFDNHYVSVCCLRPSLNFWKQHLPIAGWFVIDAFVDQWLWSS